MDIEERLVKVEVEVESIKEAAHQNALSATRMENRLDQSLTEVRATMERGFAETRKEFRWLLGVILAGFGAILGLLGRIGGLY